MTDAHQIRFMQQLGRSYRALVAGFEAHTGQSMARWRILVLLNARGEMPQKTLVGELGIDPAALTRQLKALEQAGLVDRHSAPQDARFTNVEITEAGRQVVESSMERRNEYIEWALGGMQASELEAISDTLAKLEARLTRRAAPGDD